MSLNNLVFEPPSSLDTIREQFGSHTDIAQKVDDHSPIDHAMDFEICGKWAEVWGDKTEAASRANYEYLRVELHRMRFHFEKYVEIATSGKHDRDGDLFYLIEKGTEAVVSKHLRNIDEHLQRLHDQDKAAYYAATEGSRFWYHYSPIGDLGDPPCLEVVEMMNLIRGIERILENNPQRDKGEENDN